MTRTINLAGSTAREVRLASFALVESARNGEVGQGGFDVDSPAAAFEINPHQGVTVTESDAGGDAIFQGYVGDKDIARGPFAVDADRQFDLDLVDLNTLLGDRILKGGSANRSAETDIQRVTWLATTGAMDGLFTFNIGGTGAKNMDATDYNGRYSRDVLADCAEMGGKMFFAYYDPDTDEKKVFYDLATAANYTSDFAISTVLSEVNGTTVFAARNLHRRLDGGRIYSGVEVKYNGGKVFVQNTATATTYRRREISLYDDRIKTATKARQRGEKYLEASASEEEVITCEVDLTSAQIAGGFRPGQRVSIKAPHLGIPSPVYRRLVHREVKPKGGDNPDSQDYTLVMELSNPKTVRWGSVGVAAPENPNSFGGSSTPPPPGGGGGDTTCEVVDSFDDRTLASSWGTSSSGRVWSNDTSVPESVISVGSDVGTITSPSGTNATTEIGLESGAPPLSFEALLKFRIPIIPTADAYQLTWEWYDRQNRLSGSLERANIWDIQISSNAANGSISVYGPSSNDSAVKTDWVANTWYLVRARQDNVTGDISIRIWEDGDTEPSTWDLTVNDGPFGLVYSNWFDLFTADQRTVGADIAFDFDYIQFCDTVSGSLCETVEDDFLRDEASGWGIASSGRTWIVGDSGTSSVDLATERGILVAAGLNDITSKYLTGGPWTGDSWTAFFLFSFDNVAVAGPVISTIISDGATTNAWHFDAQADTITGSGASPVAFTFAAGTTYHARWDYTYGVLNHIRVWADGDSEPAAATSTDAATGIVAALTNRFYFSLKALNATTVTGRFGLLTFLGACDPVFGQEVQYEFVAVGDGVTTSYTTAHPYRPGTLRVFVDMLPEVNVVETNPTTGAFTITGAPFNTEEIYASYQGAG